MFVGTVQLLGCSYEVMGGTMPGPDGEEAIEGIMLTFICTVSGMRVEIPMPKEYAHDLAAAIDGRKLIVPASGTIKI